MSKIKIIVGVAALLATVFTSQGQTTVTTGAGGITTTNTNDGAPTSSPTFTTALTDLAKAIESSTNWVATAGGGHSVGGSGKWLGFVDVAYDFNDYVGVLVGYDYLWGGGHTSLNQVSGGVTLQMPMHPLAFLGGTNFLTKIKTTPFVSQLIANGKDGAVSSLTIAGANFDILKFSNMELSAFAAYEKRTGAGYFNGNYGLIGIALRRNF